MHVLLVCMGSLGDTLPFVALGKALRRRGHQATLVANGYFRDLAQREGLDFAESLSAEKYLDFMEHQLSWSRWKTMLYLADQLLDLTPIVHDIIRDRYVPGHTVVAAQGYAFGARIAHESLGVPLATVHLQPLWFRSVYDSPAIPRWWPRAVPRAIDWAMDLIVDGGLCKEMNVFRETLGLGKVSRIMKAWWHSPQLVLGLFPSWFNPPQPDWPPQTLLSGFALYSPGEGAPDWDATQRFLHDGQPPLVFTNSSLTKNARRFFDVSAEVAQRLGRRALLVTPHRDQVPASLPPGVRRCSFAPFDRLLPHAAAHVHHGGIGTIAHSLAAGVPQLTVAMGFDQPDNSLRLKRLGVSEHLPPARYTPRHATRLLRSLVDSREVAERCRAYQGKFAADRGPEEACLALEKLVTGHMPAAAPSREYASLSVGR